MKISDIKTNPDNPRYIKGDKFIKLVQSIKDFPEMMEIRPVVINRDNMILGGNMRYRAAKEAGLKDIPVKVVDLTPEQQREFIIKDNVSGGEWDWDAVVGEYELVELEAWGLDLPVYDEPEIELPDGDDPEFQQMTFTIHNSQKQDIDEALAKAKSQITGDEPNENSNGNALWILAKGHNGC